MRARRSPSVRIGDVWDLEPAEIDPQRFRVRILDGEVERRAFEVEETLILLYGGGPGRGLPIRWRAGRCRDGGAIRAWLRLGRRGAGITDRLKNIAPHTACLN